MADPTLPEQIADRLRRDILRGILAPGAPIKERDAAAERGVSRTPMREAIRILAKEGLVILRPARSPVVADPSLKEVTDALAVLSVLEVLSGRLACTEATADEIAEIGRIHDRMTEGYGTLDSVALFEVDMDFHIAIAHASHNPVLAETHNAYLARLWRARYLSARQGKSRVRVLRQHGAIVEGLRRRDPDMVGAEIESHLEHLVINISQHFENREEPQVRRPA